MLVTSVTWIGILMHSRNTMDFPKAVRMDFLKKNPFKSVVSVYAIPENAIAVSEILLQ